MAEHKSSPFRANKRKNYKNKIIVKNTQIVSNRNLCVIREIDQKALDPCKVVYGVQSIEELCF